jgi:uncharacterized protein
MSWALAIEPRKFSHRSNGGASALRTCRVLSLVLAPGPDGQPHKFRASTFTVKLEYRATSLQGPVSRLRGGGPDLRHPPRELDRWQVITYNEITEATPVNMTVPRLKLPETLPVFPLTGVLLLPGTVLPLHVFEPRYRNMVEDALAADKIIGMIQPVAPRQDNRSPLPGAERETPDLYKIGCAGCIDEWEKLNDGRFFIQLKGVNRFRFEEELPLHRGYRRVRAIYRNFHDRTLPEGWTCQRRSILDALRIYGQAHGMEVKTENAERFSDLELVNLLAASLPFHPAEKQALLEAPTLTDRETTLVNLLRLGTGPNDSGSDTSSRTIN